MFWNKKKIEQPKLAKYHVQTESDKEWVVEGNNAYIIEGLLMIYKEPHRRVAVFYKWRHYIKEDF